MAKPTPALPDDKRLAELGRDVVDAAYLTGRFVLRSGAISNYYFDKYRLTTRPALLRRVAGALAAMVSPETERLAGPELGAVPLATAVSLELDLPSVFVRKQAKGYGTDSGFEGEIFPGERITVLEDVLTTGSEAIRSATALASLAPMWSRSWPWSTVRRARRPTSRRPASATGRCSRAAASACRPVRRS